MRLIIEPDYNSMSEWAAHYVAKCINDSNPTMEKPFVLGLPTGTTPIGMYRHLIKLNKEEKVSFKNVVTFNMDEYCGIPNNHEQSYHTFMWTNFFNHIDINEKNVNILEGNATDLEKECLDYEKKIKAYGGIDLFIGGVGNDGHIAFNEPGSSLSSHTRMKTLTKETIYANSRFFGNDITKVPKYALTVGVASIMEAKKVMLLVSGYNKSEALQQGVEGEVSQEWPISALQLHPKVIIVCDEPSCENLKMRTYRYYKDIEESNIDINALKS